MLESGIEVDVLNNNLFDLSVIDLCEGEGKRAPNSFIFSFKVGDEDDCPSIPHRVPPSRWYSTRGHRSHC